MIDHFFSSKIRSALASYLSYVKYIGTISLVSSSLESPIAHRIPRCRYKMVIRMEKIVRADGEEVFEEDLFIDGT